MYNALRMAKVLYYLKIFPLQDRGVATDFWVEETNRRQVVNLPQNTLKIGKGTGFGRLHSRIWGTSPVKFFTGGDAFPASSRFRRPCFRISSLMTAWENGLTRIADFVSVLNARFCHEAILAERAALMVDVSCTYHTDYWCIQMKTK